MVLVFMVLWIALFVILMKKNKELIYNPIVWLLIGWGFSFGLYWLSGINYFHKLSLQAGIYYWSIFLGAFVGFQLSKKFVLRLGSHGKNIVPRLERISTKTYALYTAIVLLGCIMTILDIFRLNSISFSLHQNIKLSGISNIGILLTALGLILWLYECMDAIINNRRIHFGAFLCLISYLLPALITSGRQSILIMGVSTFIVLFYSFSKVKKYQYDIFLKLPIGLGAIGLFSYVTLISSSRTAVTSKIALFGYMYRCTLSPATEILLEKLGVFKTFIMETLYYYSHELSMFEILYQNYSGPKFWGMSQLALVSRNIPAGNGKSIFDIVWVYLDEVSDIGGVYNHVWRSAAGNFLMDFGKIGGPLVAVITGYAAGRFYMRCRRSDSIYSTIGLALICSGMLFAMQFSPFSENYWLYPVVWLAVIPFVEKFLRKGKL